MKKIGEEKHQEVENVSRKNAFKHSRQIARTAAKEIDFRIIEIEKNQILSLKKLSTPLQKLCRIDKSKKIVENHSTEALLLVTAITNMRSFDLLQKGILMSKSRMIRI